MERRKGYSKEYPFFYVHESARCTDGNCLARGGNCITDGAKQSSFRPVDSDRVD